VQVISDQGHVLCDLQVQETAVVDVVKMTFFNEDG
jgi:hypothetical protein